MRVTALIVAALLAIGSSAAAPQPLTSEKLSVSEIPSEGAIRLFDGGKIAPIVISGDDIQPAGIASHLLADDLRRVTGTAPAILNDLSAVAGNAVIIGTLGHSRIIDAVVASKKIDVSQLRGQWETYLLVVVDLPTKNIPRALVIIGSDRRGTAYGALTLSRAIGVSPWYWWADVPPRRHKALYIAAGQYSDGPPKVKYRGIFLNDEAPALTGWAREKFGGMNSKMYVHVFELLLRLKANYLWPAMWGNAFNEDDPVNPKLANDYGIVMGTSHQEPMLRAQAEFDHRFPASDWNYVTSAPLLRKFWREGIARNKNYESIITIGLRGRNDTEMIKGGTTEQSSALLEKIVADQRKIIAEEINPDPSKVPQLWCLYKEVQDYYEHGLRVPDDVTLLWSDDNWGNLRRLPTPAERKRSGGAGIYYHFDYVGGPRSYRWINTNQLGKIWEQMNLAYTYGADRIWIVNVGDLKPMEVPIDFFMTMAWNPSAMTPAAEMNFVRTWAAAAFGETHASEIASLYNWYSAMNGRRKPELLNTDSDGIYSLTHYHEADTILAESAQAVAKAEALAKQLPDEQRAAYFELIEHPVKATAIVNQLYIQAGRNHLYARQKRTQANAAADEVRSLFAQDAALSAAYNHIADGKWNHMMDQVHLGYTSWNDPERNQLPHLDQVTPLASPQMGVSVDDQMQSGNGVLNMKPFTSGIRLQRTIEVFNQGLGELDWSATVDNPNIHLAVQKDEHGDGRVVVSVDRSKLKTPQSAHVEIKGPATQKVVINVSALPVEIEHAAPEGAFIETDGVVAIEASHFTSNSDGKFGGWREIDGGGRTPRAMTVLPATTLDHASPNWSEAPCLSYDFYLFRAGDLKVDLYVSPSLSTQPRSPLRYAIAIDDMPPRIVDILQNDPMRGWDTAVTNNVRISVSQLAVEKPGPHRLRIFAVDPGVVLQKIVIHAGGLEKSYLGPPETRAATGGPDRL
jgi:hypothetical protein